jgi:glycine cleavage system transcriptional repressor
MKYFLLSALGKDQIGIVAEVTKVLAENNCNIEDSSMTRLKNEFAMLLVIKTAEDFKAEEFIAKLQAKTKQKHLLFNIKPLNSGELKTSSKPENRALLNVYGADRIGIVADVSDLLSKFKLNIQDLHTSLTKDDLYIMNFELELPGNFSSKPFLLALQKLKESAKIDASFQLLEASTL